MNWEIDDLYLGDYNQQNDRILVSRDTTNEVGESIDQYSLTPDTRQLVDTWASSVYSDSIRSSSVNIGDTDSFNNVSAEDIKNRNKPKKINSEKEKKIDEFFKKV